MQIDDVGKMKIIADEVIEAAQECALARKTVRDHAATHAGVKPKTQE